MCDLKKVLDAGGHCVLEMPSGTGIIQLLRAQQSDSDLYQAKPPHFCL